MKQLYQRKVIGEAEELEALLDIFFNYIDLCVEEHYRDEHSVE